MVMEPPRPVYLIAGEDLNAGKWGYIRLVDGRVMRYLPDHAGSVQNPFTITMTVKAGERVPVR